MKKAIMVLLTGFLSLIIAMPALMPIVAQAESMDGMRKKRYRYRNRTHRVQVGVMATPWANKKNAGNNMAFNIDLLYGYNAGLFEIGPNIKVVNKGDGKLNPDFGGGIWAEFNIIKNTRKEKFVPSLGLKINYQRMDKNNYLLWGPNLAFKYFPASRTGLVLNFSYDIMDDFNKLFKFKDMNIGISLAYVHYFHF